jgi:hypothetical protein
MQPTTWHTPAMQSVCSAAQSAVRVQTRAHSAVLEQPPAMPQVRHTVCRTKPAPHEAEAGAIAQRPEVHTAFLLRQGSAKHWTPGPGHTGSGSPAPSARQSQPVHMKPTARQSVSVRHCDCGGGSFFPSWIRSSRRPQPGAAAVKATAATTRRARPGRNVNRVDMANLRAAKRSNVRAAWRRQILDLITIENPADRTSRRQRVASDF